ncbi:MAG: winged helix-turn-helix domain-containing tetratricopeptide repeat protein [Granulosicoccus sp.]
MNVDGKAKSVKLGDSVYTVVRGELFDSDGQLLSMRAKSANLMALLLREQGRIYNKDEIAKEIWPDVIASDESISQCVSEIRRALKDREHVIVKTYPKRGYSINAEFLTEPKRVDINFLHLMVAALVLVVMGALVAFRFIASDGHSEITLESKEPLRDLVAVLPFHSLNGAGDDAYLAIGLAEDLVIHLSELSGVSVMPSPQSFALVVDDDAPVDVADSLDARYLVYGRIHHGKDELQVSVQLIDGHKGTQVWASKYNVARDDLLTYQQAVLGNLTKAMSVAISERDERLLTLTETSSEHAFAEILRGRVAANEFSNQGNLLAEKHFRKAVKLDPNYARAYAELAAVYAIRFENGWSVLKEADEEKGMYFAQKAIELDTDLWLAHYALGRIYAVISTSNLDAAERHLRTAMSLQPDNDDARVFLAVVKILSGQSDEALAIIDSVLATHPAPAFWYFLGQGNALIHLERHEEAARAFEKCLDQMPTSPYCLRFQIVNFGLMGQREDAEWAAEEYAMLGYELSIDTILGLLLNTRPDHVERLRRGLSAAGLE